MRQRDRMAKKLGITGAVTGLLAFALFGLLQGSVIGGTIGLGIVNSVYADTASLTVLARVIIAASMLGGIVVTGIMFLVAFSSTGWAAGYMAGWLSEPRSAYDEKKHTV